MFSALHRASTAPGGLSSWTPLPAFGPWHARAAAMTGKTIKTSLKSENRDNSGLSPFARAATCCDRADAA